MLTAIWHVLMISRQGPPRAPLRSSRTGGASVSLLVGSERGCHLGISRPARTEHRPRRSIWGSALGYVGRADNPAFLGPPDGVGTQLHLDEDDHAHLDLWSVEAESDVGAEVSRLVDLGAVRVDWTHPDDADFVVLADTEGNLFCVVTK